MSSAKAIRGRAFHLIYLDPSLQVGQGAIPDPDQVAPSLQHPFHDVAGYVVAGERLIHCSVEGF